MEEPKTDLQLAPRKEISRLMTPHEILELQRAENDRLKILVDFVHRPVCAYGGSDPDPDIITAYNLAVEASLLGIRRAALGQPSSCMNGVMP